MNIPGWLKTSLYIILALIILTGIICLASKFTSCGCKQTETISYPKRDTAAQSVIVSLAADTLRLQQIIDSLLYVTVATEKNIASNNSLSQKVIEKIKITKPDTLLSALRLDWHTNLSNAPRLHNLSDTEIVIIAIEHQQNKNYKRNEELFTTQINVLKLVHQKDAEKINKLNGILYQKDVQINKFENTPIVTYVNKTTPWYVHAAEIIGSAATGLIIGRYVLK